MSHAGNWTKNDPGGQSSKCQVPEVETPGMLQEQEACLAGVSERQDQEEMSKERCQGPDHGGSSDPGISVGPSPIPSHPFPPKGKTSGPLRQTHLYFQESVKNISHLVHSRKDTDPKSPGAGAGSPAGPGFHPLVALIVSR